MEAISKEEAVELLVENTRSAGEKVKALRLSDAKEAAALGLLRQNSYATMIKGYLITKSDDDFILKTLERHTEITGLLSASLGTLLGGQELRTILVNAIRTEGEIVFRLFESSAARAASEDLLEQLRAATKGQTN